MTALSKLKRHVVSVVALAALVAAMGGTWMTSRPALAAPSSSSPSPPSPPVTRPSQVAPPPVAHAATSSGGAPSASSDDPRSTGRPAKKLVAGRINLNTATEEQLMLLPTVGPAKAERVVFWRKKNGGFKRTADLRRVKGFGYRTFKRLEPFLDVTGETTLVAKR